jgi:hypothetical protein
MQAIPGDATWWTNGDFTPEQRLLQLEPLSAATFDTGVIGITDGQILVVWFLDED